MEIASVLVISVARIGDTVLLSPCLKAIKAHYPQARLSVLAHPKRMEVLENLLGIDYLGGITKHSAAWRGWLPGKQYDVALVYGRDAALVTYALRVARSVVCFDEPEFAGIHSRYLFKVPPPSTPMHAVLHRMLLPAQIGIKHVGDLRLSVALTTRELAWAASYLDGLGLAECHPLIGLQLFSFPAKAHRDWPQENFAAFIERVSCVFPAARFIILGDQLAAVRAQSLLRDYPEALVVVAGQLSLRHSMALMSYLDLYVGVDTGPTHIAGALGIPMVAMYHWKYPSENLRPLQNGLCRAIEHPATRNMEGCFPEGMEAISVEQVLAEALPLLEAARGGEM